MTTIQLNTLAQVTAISSSEESERILTKDQYLTLKTYWKAKTKTSATEHIGYNILRGFESTRGFTSIKSANKIASNCNDSWWGHNYAAANFNACVIHPKPLNDTPAYMEGYIKRITAKADQFKRMFGLDLTPELKARIKRIEVKKNG